MHGSWVPGRKRCVGTQLTEEERGGCRDAVSIVCCCFGLVGLPGRLAATTCGLRLRLAVTRERCTTPCKSP